MTEKIKNLLFEAWAYCDEEDKSTEFMLQYMANVSGIEYDDVVDFIILPNTTKERTKWYIDKNKIKTNE